MVLRKVARKASQKLQKHKRTRSVVRRIVPTTLITKILDTGYPTTDKKLYPSQQAIQRMVAHQAKFNYRPLVSLLMPTYNTNPRFLKQAIESVVNQAYDNWQLCIVDDCSTASSTRKIIAEYASKDSRIEYRFLKKNLHISGATNVALDMARGEFIGLFDHDDILWPNALYEVVKVLNDKIDTDLVYTDEDHIKGRKNQHLAPFFKPDYNPDFLHSVNYITHFAVVRTSLMKKIGGMSMEHTGAQDWDLFLKIFDNTEKVQHVSKVLYSWRIHEDSTAQSVDNKPYVVEAQRRALEDDLKRRGEKNAQPAQSRKSNGYWTIERPVDGKQLVSIVIPSKNQYQIVKRCVDSIYKKSTYKNFEVVLIDTGSDDKNVLAWYKEAQKKYKNFRLHTWPEQPFSYARSCNYGASKAHGDYILFLNNDTEVISPRWLELMLGEARRPDIGAVGCRLYYPGGKLIQHAGVGVGLGGVAANMFSMVKAGTPMSKTQHLMLETRHNITAVTAACMMVRKSVFKKVGGFDEKYRITYNDVDLCLRLLEAGFKNTYLPDVELIHHESISLGMPTEQKRDSKEFIDAKKQFINQWQAYVSHDPNINDNIDKNHADMRLRVPLNQGYGETEHA